MMAKTLQRCEQLIHILSDGKFHSGESIAIELKVSRTAVWKLIQSLRLWQLDIYAVRGRGYQLHGGLQLLKKQYFEHRYLIPIENHLPLVDNQAFEPVVSNHRHFLLNCF